MTPQFELVQDYARMHPHVRLTVKPLNIGSHENMNRVLGAARDKDEQEGRISTAISSPKTKLTRDRLPTVTAAAP
jgi:hypothetical protein